MNRGDTTGGQPQHLSSHRLLTSIDFGEFRPGRSKDEILGGVQWRGNFEAACEHAKNCVCAVSYGLLARPRSEGSERDPSAEEDVVWAVFADDKFVKFVKWPPGEMEEFDYEGTTASRPKPTKLGDFRRLIRAADDAPIDIVNLEKGLRTRPPVPSHIDLGLTAVFLAMKIAGLGPTSPSKRDYKRNAELRDQFNASRLRIGMTEREVESMLHAKPLETGKVTTRSYAIYGSNELFAISYPLHFSNALILFTEGKVSGIYGGETILMGEEWRRQLGQLFSDLPTGPEKVSGKAPAKAGME